MTLQKRDYWLNSPDWVPVQPRSMREQGQRRRTPGYLTNISDEKTAFGGLPADTSRTEMIVPTAGHKIRLIHAKIIQENTDGEHLYEVYFGTASSGSGTKLIDILRVPDLGQDDTRTWARGHGPVGLVDEVLNFRARSAPAGANNHLGLMEYTEET